PDRRLQGIFRKAGQKAEAPQRAETAQRAEGPGSRAYPRQDEGKETGAWRPVNQNTKRLILLNLPYVLMGLFATNLGYAWRLAAGADLPQKMMSLMSEKSAPAASLQA